MGPRNVSSWDLRQVAGRPHSRICVKNLQTSMVVGNDAWGRPNKAQPILISANFHLRYAFESASVEDAVTGSTIHYGILSKTILEACKNFFSHDQPSELRDVALGIVTVLFEPRERDALPLLTASTVSLVEIEVVLPKASLLGRGVSLTYALAFDSQEQNARFSEVLTLHDLRIPTLIGVNSNERLAKQLVVATVKIDGSGAIATLDTYNQLEEIVVKTIEESSFQTLEALLTHLGQRILKYFLIPTYNRRGTPPNPAHWVTISLEKPTAVTFADAPMVEMSFNTGPGADAKTKALWESAAEIQTPPFPLRGSLDEWIATVEGHS